MTSDPETTSPALPEINNEITRITNKHKRNIKKVETLDHKTDPTKLWRTIKAVTSSEVTLCSPLVNSVPHHIISSYALM